MHIKHRSRILNSTPSTTSSCSVFTNARGTRSTGFRTLTADFSAVDLRGDSPLHLAARAEDLMATRILLHLRANPNALDATGRTPLHWAGLSGRMRLSFALMDAGAWLHVRDHDGKTFLDLANTNYRERMDTLRQIQGLMSKLDARLNEATEHDRRALGRDEYSLPDGE